MLRPPLVRASLWLLLAAAIVTLVAIEHGIRPDIARRLHQATLTAALIASVTTAVIVIAGLAVSGITSTALSLPHRLDASLMVLVWNLGTAALIVAMSGALGRRFLDHRDTFRRID